MNAGWVAANFSDHPFPEVASDPGLLVEAQIRAFEELGHDCLYAYADPLYIPEAFGCRVRYSKTGAIADPLNVTIREEREIDQLPKPEAAKQGRLPMVLRAVEGLAAYARHEVPVIGLFEGPFTSLCRVIDMEQIMRMTHRNRPVLERLLEHMMEFLLGFGRALVESGADALFVPEPTSSCTMISPTMFRDLVLPRLRLITGALDAPCILHICGDTFPIVDSMARSGAKVLSLDQCMDLVETRNKAPETALGGNVNPSLSLALGDRDTVVKDTLQCLRAGGRKRFILMTGCGIPAGAPVENVKTMIDTAKAYGLGAG